VGSMGNSRSGYRREGLSNVMYGGSGSNGNNFGGSGNYSISGVSSFNSSSSGNFNSGNFNSSNNPNYTTTTITNATSNNPNTTSQLSYTSPSSSKQQLASFKPNPSQQGYNYTPLSFKTTTQLPSSCNNPTSQQNNK
jgi:hypothetical protein